MLCLLQNRLQVNVQICFSSQLFIFWYVILKRNLKLKSFLRKIMMRLHNWFDVIVLRRQRARGGSKKCTFCAQVVFKTNGIIASKTLLFWLNALVYVDRNLVQIELDFFKPLRRSSKKLVQDMNSKSFDFSRVMYSPLHCQLKCLGGVIFGC